MRLCTISRDGCHIALSRGSLIYSQLAHVASGQLEEIMKKQILALLSATALLAVSTQAMATQVSGAVNVDNRFAVVVSQNGTNTVVYTAPSNYTWGREATRFKFNVDESNLERCHISLVNWGDGAVAEGFAGVFKGDKGAVYTGGSGWTAKESTINSGGFSNVPSASVINSIVPATSGGVTDLGSTQSHPTWGSVKPFYTPADFGMGSIPGNFNWIRPAGTNKTTKKHFVYSTPCSNLVKEAPKAIHMPGEHFQCYNLEKGDHIKTERVVVKDQFGKSDVVIGKPRMLCNPSAKVHNGKEYRIRNEKRHLVCYDYVRPPRIRPQNLRINNQFAPDEVVATRSQMFCVPSSKEHIDKIGRVTPSKSDPRPRRSDIRPSERPMPRR